ncbi:MAG: SDR family NAD(P)-dependent oxidoreductase [Candidatus Izemoplasmatales bacterium]
MKLPEELNFIENARKPQYSTLNSVTGQVVVITGATSGVGLETTKEVLSHQGNVILVVRNEDKLLHLLDTELSTYKDQIRYIIADFSSLNEVRRASELLHQMVYKIDVLVNSAGVYLTKKSMSKDGYEMSLAVNHLASFLFAILTLDLQPRRIIQINSEGHRFANFKIEDPSFNKRHYTGLKGYGSSKTAQLHTTYILSDRLSNKGISINCVHPGEVKSNIGMNNGWFYRTYKKIFINPFLKPVQVSGSAIYYHIACDESEVKTGRFYNLTIDELPAKHARESSQSKKVFDWSLSAIGLKEEEVFK